MLVKHEGIDIAAKNKESIIQDDRLRNISIAFTPLVEDGITVGVLQCGKNKSKGFTRDDLQAFSTISSINAIKIAEAKALAEVREKEIKLLKTDKLLAETKFTALRSQMNPHFVFNCINNIQYFFAIQQYEKASFYLITFSKLLRHVLQNADGNFITLDDELVVLNYYAELEQLRFEDPFEFNVVLNGVEASETPFPSMLLQPLVENAIIHGLIPLGKKGKISVTFELIDNNQLKCAVEDNGVGRAATAGKRLHLQSDGYQSKGLKLIEDRLTLLNKRNLPTSIEFIDKHDESGKPAGTIAIVRLTLPD